MKKKVFNSLFELSRFSKNLIQIVFDFFLIIILIQLSFVLRLENFTTLGQIENWGAIILTTIFSIFYFSKFVFYRSVIRYLAAKAVFNVILASLLSACTLYFVCKSWNIEISLSVPIIYFFLVNLFITSSRIMVRYIYRSLTNDKRTTIAIYGAGEAGKQLGISIKLGNKYRLVAFIDDDPSNHSISIMGVSVKSRNEALNLVKQNKIDKICLALPSATKVQKNEIVGIFKDGKVDLEIIPGLVDLLEGRFDISDSRPIQIEDLLGRAPVPPFKDLMAKLTKGKSILVTGAGGSIGSEICRQVLYQKPRIIVLLDCNEYALYKIQKELQNNQKDISIKTSIIPILNNIQNIEGLTNIFETFNFDTIYHAAAYKHVPLIEYNIIEGVKNNIIGTSNLVETAIKFNVKSFTLISSDKAVRPTNVMGATKRVSEIVCQSLASEKTLQTIISVVRFGNVIGSSGSVIPNFQEQIYKGGPLTVTHKEITRYFMSISEAAQLVIQASALANKKGEVFLLDMGEPVKILDLAEKMITLSGATALISSEKKRKFSGKKEILNIVFTGLRPGEKLYEELLLSEESQSTKHPRIMSEPNQVVSRKIVADMLNSIRMAISKSDIKEIYEIMEKANIGFKPSSDIVDYLWTQREN
jgi:FlaA1/EpsC-like NDP-sugar epimerase